MGSEAQEKICKIISNKILLADMKHMTEKISTTLPLEALHTKKYLTFQKVHSLGCKK